MSWRDKVRALRGSSNAEQVPEGELTELPKPGFVGFGSTLSMDIPEKKDAANDASSAQTAHLEPALALDRWCYPYSEAMNTEEIETFAMRVDRFTSKGLSVEESEVLADKLVIRDRDWDDRRYCLECAHLVGIRSWRCGNWRQAGVAHRASDAQLPADLVTQLQRCDGFKDANSSGAAHSPPHTPPKKDAL